MSPWWRLQVRVLVDEVQEQVQQLVLEREQQHGVPEQGPVREQEQEQQEPERRHSLWLR
jgi:hypothetical protein